MLMETEPSPTITSGTFVAAEPQETAHGNCSRTTGTPIAIPSAAEMWPFSLTGATVQDAFYAILWDGISSHCPA